jgi:hypothetical protein
MREPTEGQWWLYLVALPVTIVLVAVVLALMLGVFE